MSSLFHKLDLVKHLHNGSCRWMRRTMATVFALSSGSGKCGVGVVRITGEAASSAITTMTRPARLPPARHAVLRSIVHPGTAEVLDKGLVLWFPGPRSFTGEDIVEFQVHGGAAVLQAVLVALGELPGYRPAVPGEFTRRAFGRGKLDLTGVEGLADLLNAETEEQRRQAFRQCSGSLAALYGGWRQLLLEARATIEAHIDFGEEGHEQIADISGEVGRRVQAVSREMLDHLQDGRRGEILRAGVQLAILGRPNVGKSSCLNALLRRPAAIVSPTPGTTRDVVTGTLDLAGFPVVALDTAGVRRTDDPVEREGVSRALQTARRADAALLIMDARELLEQAAAAGAEAVGRLSCGGSGAAAATAVERLTSGGSAAAAVGRLSSGGSGAAAATAVERLTSAGSAAAAVGRLSSGGSGAADNGSVNRYLENVEINTARIKSIGYELLEEVKLSSMPGDTNRTTNAASIVPSSGALFSVESNADRKLMNDDDFCIDKYLKMHLDDLSVDFPDERITDTGWFTEGNYVVLFNKIDLLSSEELKLLENILNNKTKYNSMHDSLAVDEETADYDIMNINTEYSSPAVETLPSSTFLATTASIRKITTPPTGHIIPVSLTEGSGVEAAVAGLRSVCQRLCHHSLQSQQQEHEMPALTAARHRTHITAALKALLAVVGKQHEWELYQQQQQQKREHGGGSQRTGEQLSSQSGTGPVTNNSDVHGSNGWATTDGTNPPLLNELISRDHHGGSITSAECSEEGSSAGNLLDSEETLVAAAHYLHQATRHLGHVTGHVTTEHVLDQIFKEFCIGK